MSTGIILAFAPFLIFALSARLVGPTIALAAGAAVALILFARTVFLERKSPRILESGTAVLFTAIAIYSLVANPQWPEFGVRLIVDAGLLAVIVLSIAVRQPFTLQYARERVPQEEWSSPRFLHTNDVISLAWAIAFAVIVLCDLAVLLVPNLSQQLAFLVILIAVYVAYKFTVWYPRQQPRKP
jgi:hypothetical protein